MRKGLRIAINAIALSLLVGIPAVFISARSEKEKLNCQREPEAAQSAPADSLYELVFSEEFDMPGKVSDKWSFEIGYKRNKEEQYYTDRIENAFVGDDGYLHIVGLNDHYEGHPYTSASMTTSKSFVFVYGKVEVRAKIPVSGGAWPAIWSVGNMYNWPFGGEIDIMEYYKGAIKANACWGSDREWTGVWDSSSTDLSHFTEKDPEWADKFHVWTLDWDYDQMTIALDGEVLNTINLSQTFNQGGYNNNRENPFRAHTEGFGQYLWLNLAMGGPTGGEIDTTAFPLEYLVDYVRVYQLKK